MQKIPEKPLSVGAKILSTLPLVFIYGAYKAYKAGEAGAIVTVIILCSIALFFGYIAHLKIKNEKRDNIL